MSQSTRTKMVVEQVVNEAHPVFWGILAFAVSFPVALIGLIAEIALDAPLAWIALLSVWFVISTASLVLLLDLLVDVASKAKGRMRRSQLIARAGGNGNISYADAFIAELLKAIK